MAIEAGSHGARELLSTEGNGAVEGARLAALRRLNQGSKF